MKNQREIYEALLAGETLNLMGTNTNIKMNSDGVVLFNDKLGFCDINVVDPERWQIYKEPKWYENIPDGGVLCWCKDGESDKESIGQITEKGKANGYYTASYKHWIYATPLTKQEIQVFMENAPDGH